MTLRQIRREALLGAEGLAPASPVLEEGDGQNRRQFAFALPEGCHELSLYTTSWSEESPAGLDFELETGDDHQILASGATSTHDASSRFCSLAHDTTLLSVSLEHGDWALLRQLSTRELPRGLPTQWPTRAREAAATVLWQAAAAPLPGPPIMDWFGLGGDSTVRLPTVPGRCYQLLVTESQGEWQGGTVSVQSGLDDWSGTLGGLRPGVLVAFCAQATESRADFSLRGSNLVWVGALWEGGNLPSEEIP